MMNRSAQILDFCDECKSDALIHDVVRGELICQDCGLVLKSSIHCHSPEWNAYTTDEKMRRARCEIVIEPLKARTMGTIIGEKFIDSRGRKIYGEKRRNITRLSYRQRQFQEKHSKNLGKASSELNRIISHLRLSNDITNTAFLYYRVAYKKGLVRGRSVTNMMSAAIYIACRKKQVAIMMKDIARIANITPKELGRSIRIFLLKIKVKKTFHNPSIYVYRLGEDLKLSLHTQRVAIALIDQAHVKGLTNGKSPITMAAASLYIATLQTGEKRTQYQIADFAQTTPATIRIRFKEIQKVLKLAKFEIKRGNGAKPVIIKQSIS